MREVNTDSRVPVESRIVTMRRGGVIVEFSGMAWDGYIEPVSRTVAKGRARDERWQRSNDKSRTEGS